MFASQVSLGSSCLKYISTGLSFDPHLTQPRLFITWISVIIILNMNEEDPHAHHPRSTCSILSYPFRSLSVSSSSLFHSPAWLSLSSAPFLFLPIVKSDVFIIIKSSVSLPSPFSRLIISIPFIFWLIAWRQESIRHEIGIFVCPVNFESTLFFIQREEEREKFTHWVSGSIPFGRQTLLNSLLSHSWNHWC